MSILKMNSSSETKKEVTNGEKIHSAIAIFSSSLSDLREFSDLIETLIHKHKLQELQTALRSYQGLGDALVEFDKRLSGDIEKVLQTPAIDDHSDHVLNVQLHTNELGKKVIRVKGERESLKEFNKKIKLILGSDSSVLRAYQSSLISLVSTAESFTSKLLHIYYNAHPDALNAKEKQFTYEELSGFETLEDARNSVISWRIENLLRSSAEDWVEFFKKNNKLKLKNTTSNISSVVEIFQRRNLLVHNDGIINSIYISKTGKDQSKKGLRIRVTKDYLYKAIDRIEATFLEIAFELWAKIEKGNKERPNLIVGSSYEALQKGRWGVAIEVAGFVSEDRDSNESAALMARFNAWIARLKIEEREKVRLEISEFDCSAKDDIFKLAKKCLLGEFEGALEMLKALHSGEKITPNEIFDWPLFSDLRETDEMKNWMQELKKKTEIEKSDQGPDSKTSTRKASKGKVSFAAKSPPSKPKRSRNSRSAENS